MSAAQASARARNCGPRPKTCPAAPCHQASATKPRTPVPNTRDPLTREVKYVDPAHRLCAPDPQRPSTAFTCRDKHARYHDRSHTSVKTIRMPNGTICAVPHPQILTGYKAPGASGHGPVFTDLTSKGYFETKVRKVGEEINYLDKKLCAYTPEANRNLRREATRSYVGRQTFDCRNASYIRLISGQSCHFKTPMTTNQSYMRNFKNSTGFNNSAIFAAQSKRIHRLQRLLN